MPNSRLLWRALAWLGALLLIGSMWPIICAARPFPRYHNFALNWNRSSATTNTTTIETNTTAAINATQTPPPRSFEIESNFTVVSNTANTANKSDTINRTDAQSTTNQPVALSSHAIMNDSYKSRTPYVDTQRPAKTIDSTFRRNQTRMKSKMNRNRNASDTRSRLYTSARESLTTMSSTVTSSSLSHADADEIEMTHATPESELNLDSMNLPVENLAAGRLSASLTTTIASTTTTQMTTVEQHTTVSVVNFNNSDHGDDNTQYNNVTIFSTPNIFDELTTEPTKFQSVFIDYKNAHETVTLSIEAEFNSTKTESSTAMPIATTIIAPSTPNIRHQRKRHRLKTDSNLERIERSANLSLAKSSKRIQLHIKGRLLQVLPDGTVNGTDNEQSDYSEYFNSYGISKDLRFYAFQTYFVIFYLQKICFFGSPNKVSRPTIS